MRAADTFVSYLSSYNVQQLYETRRLLEQALEIDPNYARAYVKLARASLTAWLNPLNSDYLNTPTLDRALAFARKAVQLDPYLPDAHAVLGYIVLRMDKHDLAVAEFRRAVALNPNFTDYRFAATLIYAGDPAHAVEVGEITYAHGPILRPCRARFSRTGLLYAKRILGCPAPALRMRRARPRVARRSYIPGRDPRAIGSAGTSEERGS